MRQRRGLRRIGVTVGEDRLQGPHVVLVGGAVGVQQFMGDHDGVLAMLATAGKSVDQAQLALAQAGRVRQYRQVGRIVVKDEQADLRFRTGNVVVAAGPPAQFQAPQHVVERAAALWR